MAGHRVGFLAAATPGCLVAAWVVASLLQIGSTSSTASVAFDTSGSLKDKVITGDGVLTFDDVSRLACVTRCLKMDTGVCASFSYNRASRACAFVPPAVINTTLTYAPGYVSYLTIGGPYGATSNDRKLCSNGTAAPRGCWRLNTPVLGKSFRHVSVGPAGVWLVDDNNIFGANGWLYYINGSYQNPAPMGDPLGVQKNGYFGQLEVGPDSVWGVNAGNHAMWFLQGITSSKPEGDVFQHIYGAARWISISPQGSVWQVDDKGTLRHGPNAASGTVPIASWDKVDMAGDLQRVDAGRAGVWALDNAGRLRYRLGTCGQDGVSGTGWQQLGGNFTSVSSGTDLVVAVDTAGHVWLKTSTGADTRALSGWSWLSAGMVQAEIYQSGNVTTMWALDNLGRVYNYVV